ncbi:MAG TPA: SRPBCC family protein, partial [Dehalococcoidia bacterium]|nr:SRPBCC family protein [Dehalococcoidia bacterium]
MARWEASTLVRAKPDKVFEYLSALDKQGEWTRRQSLGLGRLEVLTPGPIDVGTQFRSLQRRLLRPARWNDSRVTIFDRPRRIGFDTTIRIGPAKLGLTHLYDLVPDGGLTKVSHRIQGPWALNLPAHGLGRLLGGRGWQRIQRQTVEGLEDFRVAAERFARRGDLPIPRRKRRHPPVRQVAAFGLLALAAGVYAAKTLRGPAPHFRFVTEWFVPAPPDEVWKLIADARTFPEWWPSVFLEVETDGDRPVEVGSRARYHTKGKLPYHLYWESVITEYDPPRTLALRATGDFVGTG